MELNKIARPALLAALMAASGTVSAVTWDFQTSPPANTVWGVSQGFDTNPASGNMITAYGLDSAGNFTSLFSRFDGKSGPENGLGLATLDPTDHEIPPGASVVLGMSAVVGALGDTFTISLGSLQSPPTSIPAENADIYECKDSKCTLRLQLGNISGPPKTNSGTFTLDVGLGYDFFQILDKKSGGGADVIITEVSSPTGSVPEPATLGLLGLGLAGLGFMRRRKAN
jgi:PEP-CTERM motif